VFVGLAIAAALASGCGGGQGAKGPKTYVVKGTVTLDGKPVSDASLTFVPSAGGKGAAAVAKTDGSGQYTARTGTQEGAVPGDYLVGISKYEYAEAAKASSAPSAAPGEMPADYKGGGTGGSPAKNALPAKYEQPATSGLKATVTEDASKNVIDFKL
jgi:hypothetical protein